MRFVVAALTFVVIVSGHATAQQLPDDHSRREALHYYHSGRDYMSSERFEKAAEEFSRAIRKDRLMAWAHYELGRAYMAVRRYVSAIKAYEGCVEAFRSLHGLNQQHRFEVENDRDREIRELEDMIRRMQMRGRTLQATQLEARVRDLQGHKALTSAPFQPPAEVLLALGSAFFRNGQRDEAEFQWKAAIEADPKRGEAHNNLAAVYMASARYAEADQELEAAEKAGFRVNPQFKEDLKEAQARR